MRFDDVLTILEDVPNYQVFLSVDELKASTHRLATAYPDTVEILPIGRSRQGDPIDAIKIGDGPKRALLFAMPHPNEPVGSMMLEYLSLGLAKDEALCKSLGYTWYLVKCIDPDGTRLNEGWFKGPLSVENYARHYYRPPAHQQVAWTFPIEYKTLHFDDPPPETQALMGLIEKVRPDFMYSLHNSDFGGVYFYIWEEAPPLYKLFHKLVESQGLPLHQGESERPYEIEFATAIYKDNSISAEYDYLEERTDTDPAEIITGGTFSFEYARHFCDPFTLICEAPFFYHPAIGDTSQSDMMRRDVLLQAIEETKEDLKLLKGLYDGVESELTVPSPFRDAIEETLKRSGAELAAEESWSRANPETTKRATLAEEYDSLVLGRAERLPRLGMFLRLLDAQIAATGQSNSLSSAADQAKAAFEAHAAELEAELDYTVVPIQKLVRVQLGSALLAADHAATRQAEPQASGS
jgi:hypothetical protein